MLHFSPLQTFIAGILQIAIGIGILLKASLNIHVIAWILILFGSMTIFIAIYLWFNDMIAKTLEKKSNQ
jgi:uncharacterized membrane protein